MKDAVWMDTSVHVVSGMATETQEACSEDVGAGDTLVTQYCLPVAVVMAPSAAAARRMSEEAASGGTEVASGTSNAGAWVTWRGTRSLPCLRCLRSSSLPTCCALWSRHHGDPDHYPACNRSGARRQ